MRTCPVFAAAQSRPDAPALAWQRRRFSWLDAEREVRRVHGQLESAGVGQGDRVAVLARNSAELAWLFYAAARAGAVLVPLNARLTPLELAPLVARSKPRLVLAEEALADRLTGAESLERHALRPAAETPPVSEIDDARVRAWLFTSGTTGQPKAAELTGGNFAASARASALNLGGDPGQRWLACLPLFHVGGLALLSRVAEYGASAVLQDGFDPEGVHRTLFEEAITHLSVVPTGLRRLLAQGAAPPSLRAVLVGGGPCPVELLSRARALGWPVLQTYGLTEASSQVATERPGHADGVTAGPALDGTSLRVVEGEIQVRGPTVMRGYAGDPEATSRAFTADGWLRTGDLGRLDSAGRLTLLSRRTDLVVSGGENVYPAEVEAALLSHPAVEDAAVCGIPDAEWGQRVVAAVQLREPVEAASLAAHCRARLAGYKLPRELRLVPSLPRNAGGKVDRVALANLFHTNSY